MDILKDIVKEAGVMFVGLLLLLQEQWTICY